jgi:hypothetical protein
MDDKFMLIINKQSVNNDVKEKQYDFIVSIHKLVVKLFSAAPKARQR